MRLKLPSSARLSSSTNLDPNIIVPSGMSVIFVGLKVPFLTIPVNSPFLASLNHGAFLDWISIFSIVSFRFFGWPRRVLATYACSSGLFSSFGPLVSSIISGGKVDRIHGFKQTDRRIFCPDFVCTITVSPFTDTKMCGPSHPFIFVLYTKTGAPDGNVLNSDDDPTPFGPLLWFKPNAIPLVAFYFAAAFIAFYMAYARSICWGTVWF